MRRALVVAGFWAASLVTARAEADVQLHWQAPPECPQGPEVRERLLALVGPSLERVELYTEAVVAREGDEYRLTLRVGEEGERRERVIVSESCADLAGAAAVALVFLLQESDVPATDVNSPPTSATAEDEGKRERQVTQPSAEDDGWDDPPDSIEGVPREPDAGDDATRWQLLVQAPIASLELGPLPEPTLGFGLGVGLRRRAWRFAARGQWTPSQAIAAAVPRAGATLQRSSGGAVVCRGWKSGTVELSPCLVLALEHLTARGEGADVSARSASGLWLAPGAELSVHLHLTPWINVFSGVAGRVEGARPRLVVEGLGELDQLRSFAFGAFLGLEWIP